MATTGAGTSTPVTPTGVNTLAQRIMQCRYRLDDAREPYLWSNDELTSYFDGLQKQLCVEFGAIEDRTTASICNVDAAEDATTLSVSARIISITKATITGRDSPLELKSVNHMDTYTPGWDAATVASAIPTTLVVEGLGLDTVRLYPPNSTADAVLSLAVFRLPLVDLDYTSHMSEPLELDRYAHLFHNYIMWQAYLKQDADTFDLKKAEYHRVLWEGQNGRGGDKDKIHRMIIRSHMEPKSVSPMTAFM